MNPPSPEETVAVMAEKIAANSLWKATGMAAEIKKLLIKAGILDVLKGRDAAKDKRIAELEASVVSHFQREHLEGDGPEIDRWRGRLAATAEVVKEMRKALRQAGHGEGTYCYAMVPAGLSTECPLCAALAKADALLAEPAAHPGDCGCPRVPCDDPLCSCKAEPAARSEDTPQHCCGVSGWNPMAGDPPCPGCAEDKAKELCLRCGHPVEFHDAGMGQWSTVCSQCSCASPIRTRVEDKARGGGR